ncbi:MAG: hypothetical protein DHS20C20_05380 [Ardenticatenaceae bacterium]|nr:MAG: hypothetical protein DHS20C20_05380 [Ardenticatenaceae bacterium]
MYWPDYSPRKKKTNAWRGVGIFIILGASFFLAGELNGWWQILDMRGAEQPEVTATAVSEVAFNNNRAGVATAVPIQPTSTSLPPLTVGAKAPDFTLPDLNDSTNLLGLTDYAGSPVILNFWASWCVPCREEMPALQRVYELHNPNGLVVLGINQTFADDLDSARAFVQELALTFLNVRDDDGNVSGSMYRVMGLPTSIFIAEDGEVVHVQVGQLTDEQISRYSEQLVAGEEIGP